MSTHKWIDRICVVAVVFALLLTAVCMNGEALGIETISRSLGYEDRLFDTTQVHIIDIVMDDWDSFIETCESEEYSICDLVIDGEAYNNVGIRGKGNTSLSSVSSMNSDRYSFKVEFDQYDSTNSYYGLDKLSLNNIIQDTTYMKDYLTYQMMGQFGVAAPLCSYVYITVNGEDWGLYLAVEGVEDSFLQRNYGTDHGELYKPDSMSFGGGRGNGRDFDMNDFMVSNQTNVSNTSAESSHADNAMTRPQHSENTANFDPSAMFGSNGTTQIPTAPESSSIPNETGTMQLPDSFDPSTPSGGGKDSESGMGSSDVKLQYIDDDPDSYSNIFDSAKTSITTADKTRLIESLKLLSEGENIEDVVNIEDVIRYFVVHNFVVNGDSYTGSMIHNYYLYEENGQLSMIPWDYNLAFGTFQGSNATSAVNDPIDTPLSVTGSGDRPIADWIFASEEYTELYHQYFAEFLESVDFAQMIDVTAELIAPYVEKDPSKFYTYEEFESGFSTLREFCLLREESILGQLSGTIPSTSSGQSADGASLVDASHITLSDMGSMGGMGGDFSGGDFNSKDGRGNRMESSSSGSQEPTAIQTPTNTEQSAEGTTPPADGDSVSLPTFSSPADSSTPQLPNGAELPTAVPSETANREPTQQLPNGVDFSSSGSMDSNAASQRPDTAVNSEGSVTQIPDMSGNFTSEKFPSAMDSMDMGGMSQSNFISSSPILLVISLVVLLAGLIVATKYTKY